MTDTIFSHRLLNLGRLLANGFREQGGRYVRVLPLMNGEFEMTVAITGAGVVSASVTDLATQEPYTLYRVPGACGAFVGRVRDEYEKALAEIAEQCFDPDVFKSGAAKQIISYARETYRDELEYLWEKFPRNAVLRRKDNAKWYAALLTVSGRKLGLDSDEIVEIIDLRGEAESLVDFVRYFPGYHMNKKHWFTILLDGSVPIEEIFGRIDASYEIARRK